MDNRELLNAVKEKLEADGRTVVIEAMTIGGEAVVRIDGLLTSLEEMYRMASKPARSSLDLRKHSSSFRSRYARVSSSGCFVNNAHGAPRLPVRSGHARHAACATEASPKRKA